MTTYWCQQAWLGDLDGEAAHAVVITVEGDRITDVRINAAPPANARRLDGLTLPGMANAHSHAFIVRFVVERTAKPARSGRGATACMSSPIGLTRRRIEIWRRRRSLKWC